MLAITEDLDGLLGRANAGDRKAASASAGLLAEAGDDRPLRIWVRHGRVDRGRPDLVKRASARGRGRRLPR
jgi:hypothetical protein